MPSVENPFEDVLTEKEWTKARDKTGLTSGLTEKMSMGKELTTFHRAKDAPAARRLQEKIALYLQVLKAKHAKDKYYAKLLKLVQEQQQAVQTGLAILENAGTIAEVRERLRTVIKAVVDLAQRVKDLTQTKQSEIAFTQRFEEMAGRARALRQEMPEGTFVLPGDAIARIVQLEKDFAKTQQDLEAEGADSEYDDEAGGIGNRDGRTNPQMHWDRVMVPLFTAIVNKVVGKNPQVDLVGAQSSGLPQALLDGLLGPVRDDFTRSFDPNVIKPLTDSHKPDPRDPLTTRWAATAERLITESVATTVQRGQGTQWFRFVGESAPKQSTGKKQTFNPKPGVDSQTNEKIPSVPPEEYDEKKAYSALMMKLAQLKADASAGAEFLSSKKIAALFPYEQTDGRKEVDPANKKPSALTKLREIGIHLVQSVETVRASLNTNPPNLQAARGEMGRITQTVSRLSGNLPRHGDVVEKGVAMFVLDPLEKEIAAKGG